MSKEDEPTYIVEQAEETIEDSIYRRIGTIEEELSGRAGEKISYLYARELVDVVNDLWELVCETDEDWELMSWGIERNEGDIVLRKGKNNTNNPYIPGR